MSKRRENAGKVFIDKNWADNPTSPFDDLDWGEVFKSNELPFLREARQSIAQRVSSPEVSTLDLEDFKADLRSVGIQTRRIKSSVVVTLYKTMLNSQLEWLDKKLQERS